MTNATSDASLTASGGRARRIADLASGLLVSLIVAGATSRLLALPASYLGATLALYGTMSAVLLWGWSSERTASGFGPANRVTLGRAALAIPVMALCIPPGAIEPIGRWWVIGVSTVGMLLDGVDGKVARRTGTQSAFGARFDMELDAALIMALSILVWAGGHAGVWALLIGLMRYGFVAAGWLWPALNAELPESMRRKVVCVVQGVVLLVALGPIIPPLMAQVVVAVGLAALVYSFAVDVRWALRQ